MIEPLFLIDSNILIYILGDAASNAARRFSECDHGEVATSVIAYAEVMRGIPHDDHRARASAQALFDLVVVIEFDLAAAETYGRLPFKRARFDRLIAAHALALDLTLVTANERDFADIPELRIENWAR